MLNYREFEVGPDPFGRKFQVLLQYLQTAISIRHADCVDVKFLLVDESGRQNAKVIALRHPDLVRLSRETGRPMDDPWCARLAELHLRHVVQTGEDMEKSLITVPYAELEAYAAELRREEEAEIRK